MEFEITFKYQGDPYCFRHAVQLAMKDEELWPEIAVAEEKKQLWERRTECPNCAQEEAVRENNMLQRLHALLK